MNNNVKEQLTSIGITDTRRFDLKCGLDRLHSSMCMMDSANNRRLIAWIDSYDSFGDFMNDYAGLQQGLRNDF